MSNAPPPPGSSGLPFVGEMLSFVQDPFTFFESRYRNHGPVFRTRLLGDEVVCLVGPEAFAKIYDEDLFTREQGSPPHVRELFHPEAIPFLSGEAQRRRRALLMGAFTPDAVDDYAPVIRRVIERYLRTWAERGEVRGVQEFSRLCFTIADALFTGADPDRDDPELATVFEAFGAGIFAMPVKLPFTTYGKALAARDRLREHVARAVDGYDPSGDASHVLARLVAARDGEDELRKDELKIELLHFFAAAHGALQGGMAHVIRALADHPAILERTTTAVEDGDTAFVSQVTKEARRAYKIAPSTFFAVVRRDAEIFGYAIKKGWKAVGVIHSTQRDADAFASPADFDPDRFAEGDPPGYVAHGTGPWTGHRCAGEALANLVLDAFVTAAVSGYTWSLPEQDLTEVPAGFAPQPRDGLRLHFRAKD